MLTLAIVATNDANRINVVFRTVAGSYQPAVRSALCPRAWDSAHIDDDANLRGGEQIDEIADRACVE
jgi:hypothetical protein